MNNDNRELLESTVTAMSCRLTATIANVAELIMFRVSQVLSNMTDEELLVLLKPNAQPDKPLEVTKS